MAQGLLLVDTLNITHAANNNKPLSVGDQPTQAIFGFLRSLRLAAASFPQLKPVCLHDGRSWRYKAFDGYKASRSKPPTTANELRMSEMRDQVKLQLPFIRKALQFLGVTQINTLNLEADDLAALMVRRSAGKGKIMLLSADKDWAQLIAPSVSWFDPIHDIRISHATMEEKLGVKSGRAWLEVKALMGDTSDDVPGVGGIGDKGAKELINVYGSVTEFLNRAALEPDLKLPKKFADLATSSEKQDIFMRNMVLMDLNHRAVPAPVDLRVDHGAYDESEFEAFCHGLMFKSILTDVSGWMEPFRRGK